MKNKTNKQQVNKKLELRNPNSSFRDMNFENLCRYNKFGYCKFEQTCRLNHFDEICEIPHCEIQLCEKRHP